jgi:hypothetical protein
LAQDQAAGRWSLEQGKLILGEGAPGGAPPMMPITSADERRLVIRK